MENSEKDTIQDFQYGDVVIARRYHNKEEKQKIIAGHRIGPFVVLEKQGDKYLCVYGTTKSEYKKTHEVLEFYSERLTYFILDRIYEINKNDIGGKIDSLDERKKEILNLKLKRKSVEEKELTEGDIISFLDKIYYTYRVNPVVLMELKEGYRTSDKVFSIFGKEYIFDFNSNVIYGKIDNYKIIDYLDNEQINHLKKCFFTRRKMPKLERGMLIEYLNRIYYVYGIDKDRALLYQVNKREDIDNSRSVYVNNREYEASFESLYEISIDSLYFLLDRANLDEIEKNRVNKKKFYKIINRQKPPTFSDFLLHSKIVCDTSLDKTEYLILTKDNYKLTLISLEDIEKGNYKNITIRNTSDVFLRGTYDYSEYIDILFKVCEYYELPLQKDEKVKIKEKRKERKRKIKEEELLKLSSED